MFRLPAEREAERIRGDAKMTTMLLIMALGGFTMLLFSFFNALPHDDAWERSLPVVGGLAFGICGIVATIMMLHGKPVGTRYLEVGDQYQVLTSHGEYFVVQRTDEKNTSSPLFIKRKEGETIPPHFVVWWNNKLLAIQSDNH